ncbi:MULTISPECIES: response regulator transcription factor [Caballeronia]|jgi:DNA-binding NarL/FixJ family response regulator|uniref:DNA-binding response regulator n=1 Tax=Caballeronia grimmiae TaxID=1071679 RepID=A0A069NYK6_9BURK|nr:MULTISPECIES: response regulator transcription factor [Caballeronia]KDR33458.1 LuxR family transcriptional regulator [Caballeronia grimmiae]MDR5734129.1 response regulator transcription factor [Caballeronia sp. LZ025]GGD71774.1 DNA-binding response regulator [Caballeronia grimmiae]
MRFLVADDHELIRQAVKSLLRGIDPDAQFDDADSWDTLAAAARPEANHDLAIVDLHMSGMAGASSLTALLKANPALPLVVLSAEESVDEMRAVLAAGALGFVPKREPANVMLKAIELVLSGGAYVPIEALSLIGGSRVAPPRTAAPSPNTSCSGPAVTLAPHHLHLMENLSPRQREIMRLVHQGCTNKMIARELQVAEGTVKVHLSVIFRALGVHNRSSAIAVINGWLQAGREL